MGRTRLACGLACAAMVLATVSCARLGLDRWGFGGDDKSDAPAAAAESAPAAPSATEAERETLLRQQVAEYMAATSGDQARLVRRRPYYFKEYSVYSGGPESARISVTETDLRLKPYIASVELDKQRYATRQHRDREEAEADQSFLRDTGTEKLTYDWRGSHWEFAGSFFVAAGATEEQIDGQWQPLPPAEKRTVAAEEEKSKGFLGRALSLITGD